MSMDHYVTVKLLASYATYQQNQRNHLLAYKVRPVKKQVTDN